MRLFLTLLLLSTGVVLAQDLSPDCGAAGDYAVISGEDFADEPAVAFDGVAAEVIRSRSDRILVRVPTGVTAGDVVVTIDGAAADETFTVVTAGAPVVLRTSADKATPGSPLYLIGRRMGGGDVAFVDGAGVEQAVVEPDGGDRIAVLAIPETLAPGVYTLRVTNEDGLDSDPCSPELEVVVAGEPTLTAVEPESPGVGQKVMLTGTDLGPAGFCRVRWTDADGEVLRPVGFSNGYDTVYTRVPFFASAGGTYDVAIELRDDTETNELEVTLGTPEAPVLTELTPNAGPAGVTFRILGSDLFALGGETEVTLTSGATTVEAQILFGVPAFGDRDAELLVRVPADTADGTYDVAVTVAGQSSNTLPFTVGAQDLSVSALTPSTQGTKGTFRPLRIEGTGFGLAGGDRVAVVWDDGGTTREGIVVFRTDTLLVVIPPGGRFEPLAAGTYDVRVVLDPFGSPTEADAGEYTVE